MKQPSGGNNSDVAIDHIDDNETVDVIAKITYTEEGDVGRYENDGEIVNKGGTIIDVSVTVTHT